MLNFFRRQGALSSPVATELQEKAPLTTITIAQLGAKLKVVKSKLEKVNKLAVKERQVAKAKESAPNELIQEHEGQKIHAEKIAMLELSNQYSIIDSQREIVETKTQLEVERLYSLSQIGLRVLNIKKAAVDSAKLSVEANQKSYAAGVRGIIDVINSIQALFQARNECATAATQQAKSDLHLQLVQAEDPVQAIKQIQVSLF